MCAFFACAPSQQNPDSGKQNQRDDLRLMTYNIHGLITNVDDLFDYYDANTLSEQQVNIRRIVEKINQWPESAERPDSFFFQETFSYWQDLRNIEASNFPHRSNAIGSEFHPDVNRYLEGTPESEQAGDGLNRFAAEGYGFENFKRYDWGDDNCHGDIFNVEEDKEGFTGDDCTTRKGFSCADQVFQGQTLLMCNLHMDAGNTPKDREARQRQLGLLLQTLTERAPGKPIILAGDFNFSGNRQGEAPSSEESQHGELLMQQFRQAGFKDACEELDCQDPGLMDVDRVLFHPANTSLRVRALKVERVRFGCHLGEPSATKPLSDHCAITATLSF